MPESKVRLDLNNPVFQEILFRLEKTEQHAMISALRKISELTWDQPYRDQGLKWEAIHSRNGPKGERMLLATSRVQQAHNSVNNTPERFVLKGTNLGHHQVVIGRKQLPRTGITNHAQCARNKVLVSDRHRMYV